MGTITQTIANNLTTGLGADVSGINFRNIIINGDMSIAQRGTSEASVGNSFTYFTVDRFKLGGAGSSSARFTMSQDTDVPNGQGFATSLKMDCTTADASLGSSDALRISQFIEGQNLQYLKKGTANAESTTLSFWVKSNKTGTYISELRDMDNARAISKSYTIDVADTWEKKTLTFAGDTSGAFDNDNSTSLRLANWLYAGTDYTSGTLQTSWGTLTATDRAVGQVNFADSTDNNIWITGVQLEAGTSASDFEFLPHDVNLRRCERYYSSSFEIGVTPALDVTKMNYRLTRPYDGANHSGFGTTYPTTMRTSPSVTLYTTNPSAGSTGQVTVYDGSWSAVGAAVDASSTQNHFAISSALGASVVLVQFNYTADAEL